MRHLNIRERIILFFIAIILFLGVASSIIITTDMQEALTHEFYEEGEREVMFISQLAAEPLLTNDLVEIKKLIDTVKEQDNSTIYVVITDSSNQPLVHTFDEGYPVELTEIFKLPGEQVSFRTQTGEEVVDFRGAILKGVYTVHVGLTKKTPVCSHKRHEESHRSAHNPWNPVRQPVLLHHRLTAHTTAKGT